MAHTNTTGTLFGFSGKMASGKSTTAHRVAHTLNEKLRAKEKNTDKDGDNTDKHRIPDAGFAVISFADALRKEVAQLLRDVQDSATEEEFLKTPSGKETSEKNARAVFMTLKTSTANTRRTAMQLWGSKIRRAQDPQYWVAQALDTARAYTSRGINVIFDDVRFVNEAEEILSNGGYLIRLEIAPAEQERRIVEVRKKKPLPEAVLNHVSETDLDNFPHFSLVTNNTYPEKSTPNIITWVSYHAS